MNHETIQPAKLIAGVAAVSALLAIAVLAVLETVLRGKAVLNDIGEAD